MWITADGQGVRLSEASIPTIRRSIAGERSIDDASFRRQVEAITKSAHQVGRLTHRPSGVELPVFRSDIGGSKFAFVTYPVNRDEHVLITVRPIEPQHEYEDGPGTRIAQNRLRNFLLRALGNNVPLLKSAVRFGRRQVDQQGTWVSKKKTNKPDVAFIDTKGQRVNVEIDTDLKRSLHHMKQLDRDSKAKNIFLIIDDFNGNVLGGQVHDGGQKRPLTAEETRRLSALIPSPRRHPDPGPPMRKRKLPIGQPGWRLFEPAK